MVRALVGAAQTPEVSKLLTQRREVGILRAEQEKVDADLLTRAVQGQLLIEVRGGAEVLNSLDRRTR